MRLYTIPVLLSLEVAIHNTTHGLTKIPKASLDYNLYILAAFIGLNVLRIPLPCRRAKAPFLLFPGAMLDRTPVTPCHQAPLLRCPTKA